MTVVVLGLDALDPDLVDPEHHPNLVLDHHRSIGTIASHAGEPSTHELWPTIITGVEPSEHGLVLEDGVAWENPFLRLGSSAADFLIPDTLQSRIGAWLLTNTTEDAFRTPKSYYSDRGLTTVFDGLEAKPIGIPNYVIGGAEDREHQLRRQLGSLFERDPDAVGGHTSADPVEFYEQCIEMALVRLARARSALRSQRYGLVFAYTSGLDLIGHVAHGTPKLQERAYAELDEFVGEVRADLDANDELLLVSDHGLQNGVHTNEAMAAGTSESMVGSIESVCDVRDAIETEIQTGAHRPSPMVLDGSDSGDAEAVRTQLEDLGYM